MKVNYAIVRGKLPFPVDMLRYDKCYPATEQDSMLILQSIEREWPGEFKITEISVGIIFEKGTSLTIARWESFGWTALHKERNMLYVDFLDSRRGVR